MKWASLSLAFLVGLSAIARPAEANAVDPSIVRFLDASAYDWNHGKLDAFMTSYENAPTTEYVGAKGVTLGYAAIRAHYAAHYGKAGMGTLHFSDVTVRPLGAEYAVIVARWHLATANGSHPSGLFSLVLHRAPKGWRILVDHTP